MLASAFRLGARRFHVFEHDLEREGVLLGQARGRCRYRLAAACSSTLNERQNFLRSASPHARLMRAPNGVCRINCMPPAFIKETFGDDGGDRSEPRRVFFCRRERMPPLAFAPAVGPYAHVRLASHCTWRRSSVALVDRTCAPHATLHARVRSYGRDLRRSRTGSSAVRHARILHPHDAGLHAADHPRCGAEQRTRRRPNFRPRNPHRAVPMVTSLGFGNDLVVGGFGNRAARRDRRHPRAAPRTQSGR